MWIPSHEPESLEKGSAVGSAGVHQVREILPLHGADILQPCNGVVAQRKCPVFVTNAKNELSERAALRRNRDMGRQHGTRAVGLKRAFCRSSRFTRQGRAEIRAGLHSSRARMEFLRTTSRATPGRGQNTASFLSDDELGGEGGRNAAVALNVLEI